MRASLTDKAVEYAGQGWPVFPVSADTKRPRTKHGHLNATKDVDQLREWWKLFDYGGAIATPTGQGLLVIDVDPRNGGRIQEWMPPTRTVRTQHGGWHLHYKLTGGDIISKANLFGRGIDSKSAGGYVLLPPSPGYFWSDTRPRTVLLRPFVEAHIVPGIINEGGGTARLAPQDWYRGVIHDQVVAWAAYFAGVLDDDAEVERQVWGIVQQAKDAGLTVDNAGGHIDAAIRWVLTQEARS